MIVRTPRALRFRGRRDVSCLLTDTLRTVFRHPRILTLSNAGGYLNVARQVTALARIREAGQMHGYMTADGF